MTGALGPLMNAFFKVHFDRVPDVETHQDGNRMNEEIDPVTKTMLFLLLEPPL